MAIVIGIKGVDLSVGAIIAIVGATLDWRIHAGDPHLVALAAALAVGFVCGAWNGFLVAALDIQPIIATLILMVSGRGVGLMINLGLSAAPIRASTARCCRDSASAISGSSRRASSSAWRLALALWALVRRTAFGLFLEAVGANPKAARTRGRRSAGDQIRRLSHLAASWRAAAGVILTADTHTSDPVSVGLYIELDAILAVVIGGGSLNGGRVHLLGAASSARWSSRR